MQLHAEHLPGWTATCEVRALATQGPPQAQNLGCNVAAG